MHYENIQRATFLARPNRFIAHVELAGATEICHVKNTGRCKELLLPGATVYIQEFDSPTRKTKFDLIGVEKEVGYGVPGSPPARLINMDSQAPNKVFGEWAASGAFADGLTLLKPETTWGNSRFDFYWEAEDGRVQRPAPTSDPDCAMGTAPKGGAKPRRGFVEVKGVTLEVDGAAYFPDAPTQRGVKHVEELIAARAEGYEAALCFVIQMRGVKWFSPNDATHPQFGAALRRAAAAGVRLMAYDCAVTPDSLTMGAPVPIRL